MKKRIFFSQRDIQKIFEFLPRGMNTVVDRDEGRCVVFLQNSQGRGIGGILAQSLIRFGMQAWAADLHDDPEELYELSVKNRANVWFGEAITIYRATRILAEKHDLSKLGMQCIFITMTNLPQSMIDYLAETWQCRVSTHYGLTESGWGLAVDCDVCSGYHYNEIDHIIEIVDPDTGAPLPYGEEGEVVLTNSSCATARGISRSLKKPSAEVTWMCSAISSAARKARMCSVGMSFSRRSLTKYSSVLTVCLTTAYSPTAIS